MVTIKKLLSLITLFSLPAFLYPHIIKINNCSNKKQIVNNMSVEDFSLHPTQRTVMNYLHKKYTEIFDLETRIGLKIKDLDTSDMISCAWLYFDYKKNNKIYKPLAIGFKSGIIILLIIDLDKQTYEIIKKFDLKQPISHIEANIHLKSPGSQFWAVTTGHTSMFNDEAYTYFFIKDQRANTIKIDNSIFRAPAFPGFETNKNKIYSSLAWQKKSNNNNITVINGFFDNKLSSIILSGKYGGLDHYPLNTNWIATGKHDVEKNERARVNIFNIKTKEFIFSFPMQVPGSPINDLSFNKEDQHIVAVGYGGYVDIWYIDAANKKAQRVGYVQPQPAAAKKIRWWKVNDRLTWFFVLYECGLLGGWEIETNQKNKN